MRATFAPIKTRPTQDAFRALNATSQESPHIYPDLVKKGHTAICHQTDVVLQFNMTTHHQCIRKSNTKPAGKMVVAGTTCS
jgi:hypothetical protein